jgi:hypothetical protein
MQKKKCKLIFSSIIYLFIYFNVFGIARGRKTGRAAGGYFVERRNVNEGIISSNLKTVTT